jgi:hypothetical protein
MDICNWAVMAVHLVPYNLGPEIQVALFGEEVGDELTTVWSSVFCYSVSSDINSHLIQPHNGLLLETTVASALASGTIAIVPDLPDEPTAEQIAQWEQNEPKNYRWQIIDEEAEVLDELIDRIPANHLAAGIPPRDVCLDIRDLDGKRISFRNDNRPRARYLHLLFVVAQLKRAWRRQQFQNDPAATEDLTADLKELHLGPPKGSFPWWATGGRYLNGALMAALAEEIGNIPFQPMPGANRESRKDWELGLLAIAKVIAAQPREYEDDYESEEEDE